MKFSIATLLLPLAASASTLQRRVTWDEYHAESQVLSDDGLCRSYATTQPPAQAEDLVLCEWYCASARDISTDQGTFSWTCFADTGDSAPTFPDPDGVRYKMGECKCNHPVINFIGDTFAEALPAIGHVTCAVWKLATSEAAQLIAGTPFKAATATQTLIKVAKQISKISDNGGWEDWVRRVSEDAGACDFSPAQLFQDFTGISDEDIAAVL
ncbi:hypothetical protein LIA77_09793 [Sarocladium implicatum]|nr:hypothetical protein LIA77_09793 [Sarocladium implicatum]